MSDTQRTRLAVLALFPDNTLGEISPQDLRDFVVTVMDADFAQVGDFWSEPVAGPSASITEGTTKGWHVHSQIILSEISFGRVCAQLSDGWVPADASILERNLVLGVAADSYIAGISNANILRRGLIFDSGLSARLASNIGKLMYLANTSLGDFSVTIEGGTARIIGAVEYSAWSSPYTGKWRFDPNWGVTGS